MITVIYGSKNGTQDSIAWWLCTQENFGPQVYDAPFLKNRWTRYPDENSGLIIDQHRLEEYVECHRRMENIRGDIIEPIRVLESKYKNLVWSNFFGSLKYPDQEIKSDKLIICDQSKVEDCFHYMITHAFNEIDHKKIDDHSEVWWMDHKLVDGEEVSEWKSEWYENYHQKMHDAYDTGKLKYMWQLNFMHWDLNRYLKGELDCVELNPPNDLRRIIKDRALNTDVDPLDVTLAHNKHALYIKDPHWFERHTAERILDYLDIKMNNDLQYYLDKYQEAYRVRREWFDKILQDL